jgi:hypothetical protein
MSFRVVQQIFRIFRWFSGNFHRNKLMITIVGKVDGDTSSLRFFLDNLFQSRSRPDLFFLGIPSTALSFLLCSCGLALLMSPNSKLFVL